MSPSDDGILAALVMFIRPVPAGMIDSSNFENAGTPAVLINLIAFSSILFLARGRKAAGRSTTEGESLPCNEKCGVLRFTKGALRGRFDVF